MSKYIVIICMVLFQTPMYSQPLEEQKLQYLINYLIEQGELDEKSIDSYPNIEIGDLLPLEKYNIDFKIMKFRVNFVEDARFYVCIERKDSMEVFDLCNSTPFYSSIIRHLKTSKECINNKDIINFMYELSKKIEVISPPYGVRDDGNFKSTVTCW